VVPTIAVDWIEAGPFTDYSIAAIPLFGVSVFAALVFVALLARPWAGAPFAEAELLKTGGSCRRAALPKGAIRHFRRHSVEQILRR
jgi:hypothetical protein